MKLFCLVPLNWWGKKIQEAQGWYTVVCEACWEFYIQNFKFNTETGRLMLCSHP